MLEYVEESALPTASEHRDFVIRPASRLPPFLARLHHVCSGPDIPSPRHCAGRGDCTQISASTFVEQSEHLFRMMCELPGRETLPICQVDGKAKRARNWPRLHWSWIAPASVLHEAPCATRLSAHQSQRSLEGVSTIPLANCQISPDTTLSPQQCPCSFARHRSRDGSRPCQSDY